MIIEKIEAIGPIDTLEGFAIPFSHGSVVIFQGYNGPFSHFAMNRVGRLCKTLYDDRFCLDFALPVGTPVLASKSGVVRYVTDFSDEYYEGIDISEGFSCPANFIAIGHEDDRMSIYSHIAKRSSRVKPGDEVERGQVIAETGKSGWIGPVPHLHFAAYSHKKPDRQTYPVIFEDYDGPLEHSDI